MLNKVSVLVRVTGTVTSTGTWTVLTISSMVLTEVMMVEDAHPLAPDALALARHTVEVTVVVEAGVVVSEFENEVDIESVVSV